VDIFSKPAAVNHRVYLPRNMMDNPHYCLKINNNSLYQKNNPKFDVTISFTLIIFYRLHGLRRLHYIRRCDHHHYSHHYLHFYCMCLMQAGAVL